MSIKNSILSCVLVSCVVMPRAGLADIQITGLQDYSFGTISPPYTDQEIEDSICIYKTASPYDYDITIDGENDFGGNYFMVSGANTLGYGVGWAETVGGAYTQMTPGTLDSFTGASATSGCTGGDTAEMEVGVPALVLSTAKAGSYSDTLTIVASEP